MPSARQRITALAIARQRHQGVAKRFGVELFHLRDGAAADFRQRRRAPGNHRRAARHGLDDWQAKAFVHRGKHEHLRQTVERRQIGERHIAGEPDRVGGLQALDVPRDPARQPAVGADTDQLVAAGLRPR